VHGCRANSRYVMLSEGSISNTLRETLRPQ
jgi:hypothetical protein